jgi:hypothetical protein
MPPPGVTGSKGGGRGKQDASPPSVSDDPREQFRMWIRDAVDSVGSLGAVPLFPLGAIVEQYFASPSVHSGHASDFAAMRNYNWYANHFYIHIAVSSGNPTADIVWPGSEGSCNLWSEIEARPLHQGKRIIDCEGYAFIASRLFAAAGWTLDGFRIAYGGALRQSSNFAYHVAAQLTSPRSRAICVGTHSARTRSMHDEARDAMRPYGAMRVMPDVFPTQAAAVQAVRQHAQQQGALTPADQILGP